MSTSILGLIVIRSTLFTNNVIGRLNSYYCYIILWLEQRSYNSVRNILSSSLLPTKLKIITYKTTVYLGQLFHMCMNFGFLS